MKKHLLFLCFQLIFLLGIGQTVNVHGYVIDAESGDNLPYASVYDSISEQRALCNDYGFFSMKIPKGTVKLKASFASYQSASLSLTLRADTLLSIGLVPGSVDEVLIEAERGAARPIIGRINVPIAQLTEIPTIGGEKDPLKAIVLLPGISQGTEASTGFRVRGGGPDQNLILLDETPVYNVSHLFGFISVFNANAIKSIDLYKGGFPARYGGRLSSVVNVQMKEGNVEKRKTAFGIGLLSSHYHQEGPLKKLGDRSSYLISARASYAGIVSLPVWAVFRAGQTDYYLNYWLLDLNAKIQHQFAKGGKLYWSTYIGNDDWRGREGEARVSETQFGLNWGNQTSTLRYNKVLNPRLFFRAMAYGTRYQYQVRAADLSTRIGTDSLLRNELKTQSSLIESGIKIGLEYYPAKQHTIRTGIQLQRYAFYPFKQTRTAGTGLTEVVESEKITFPAYNLYLEDEFGLGSLVSGMLGLRYAYLRIGAEDYHSWEPRLNLTLHLPARMSMQLGASRMFQPLHLLTANGAGLPNDIWIPATNEIPPSSSWQYNVGLTKSFARTGIDVSVEAYYKESDQLTFINPGSDIESLTQNWEEGIRSGGQGRAYGVEAFIHRRRGKWDGWMAYTWSWSLVRFEGINEGNWFRANFDRRHEFNLSLNYDLSDRWKVSTVWVYMSGRPLTLPSAIATDLNGRDYPIFTEINGQETPNYHRLDLGFVYKMHSIGLRERSLRFGVYNAYNRRNPFFMDVGPTRGQQFGFEVEQVSLFPALPYIAFETKF